MNKIKGGKKSADRHFARLQNLIILWSGCNSNSGQLVTNVSGFKKNVPISPHLRVKPLTNNLKDARWKNSKKPTWVRIRKMTVFCFKYQLKLKKTLFLSYTFTV